MIGSRYRGRDSENAFYLRITRALGTLRYLTDPFGPPNGRALTPYSKVAP